MGTTVEVNPIRKVVTLMQEMKKEVEAEGEAEKELFEKFMCYCKNNDGALAKNAADAASAGEEMRAKVASETSEKKQVDQDLAQAKKDRADAKGDLAKATKLREKEHKEYLEENADAEANLAATGKAIESLEKGMGGAFLQSAAGSQLRDIVNGMEDRIEAEDKEALAAFLSMDKDYAPASGQIVGILKNMKDEMIKSIGQSKEAEEAAAKQFAELSAAKNKEIQATTEAIESLTKRSGELAVSIVQNKNAAEDSEEEAADAVEFLANLKKTCAEKEKQWEERQKTRAEEISAIGQAIAILNEDDALDLFKKTMKTPEGVDPKTGMPTAAPQVDTFGRPVQAFLQVRRSKGSALAKARALLGEHKFNSSVPLSLLSHMVLNQIRTAEKSGKVDFSKVLKMIDDMVVLLGQEQKDDGEHLEFCRGEFDSSEDKQKELEGATKALSSSISEMADEIKSLAGEIANAGDNIKATDTAVAEASAQRKAEHAEFTATVQANQMAIELIGKAKNKLQLFYNPELATPETPAPTPSPYAFLQLRVGQPGAAPETFGDSYEKKSGKSGGVMGLMDKMIKELEMDVKEAEHDESTAQKDYEELMAESQKSNEEETKKIAHKSKAKADLESSLEETKRGHALKEEALGELKTYIQELHGSCDFIMANFEVRKEARTKEIEGLKNAKAVLAGADYSF